MPTSYQQPLSETRAGHLPAALLKIARSLGEPMRATRSQVLPVSRRRRFHIWEFQALVDTTRHTVIAVDVCDRSIVNWKHLSTSYEAAIDDYQQRIAQCRPDTAAMTKTTSLDQHHSRANP